MKKETKKERAARLLDRLSEIVKESSGEKPFNDLVAATKEEERKKGREN